MFGGASKARVGCEVHEAQPGFLASLSPLDFNNIGGSLGVETPKNEGV